MGYWPSQQVCWQQKSPGDDSKPSKTGDGPQRIQGMAVADAAASCGAEEGDGDESAGGIGAELEAGNIFMGFIYYN